MADETTPLRSPAYVSEEEREEPHGLHKSGLRCLLIQHASNASGDRTSEYLFYLLLVIVFKDTLLPSAIFGFFTTLTGIALSRWTGTLVDRNPKLPLVRTCIAVQKLSATIAYLIFAILFSQESIPSLSNKTTLLYYALIVLSGAALRVSTICIQIAIEKDWVISISHGSDRHLSTLNISLRRVDLMCNLLSPLAVSLLTTLLSYRATALIMSGVSMTSLAFEFYWIQVVYLAFPQLRRDDEQRSERMTESSGGKSFTQQRQDWAEFVKLPIFLSSVSLSLLYVTVLSFDGNMLGYLKTKQYEDSFLALMRALGVLTGLLGTVLAPQLENKVGSVRAGSWSIWSEVVCLLPVAIAFGSELHKKGTKMDAVSGALVFAGMATSRIGLWSFDLIQLKQLQETLANHPRRNTLTALQYSMANMADLLKYVLAIALSKPSQFPWAAIVSFLSVFCAATTYTVYLRQERGHLFHSSCLTRKDL